MNKGPADLEFEDFPFWREGSQVLRVGGWRYHVEKDLLHWDAVVREIHEVDENYAPEMAGAISFYSSKEPGRKAISSAVESAIERGVGWDLECRFCSAKGRDMWVRAVGKAVRNEKGDVVELQGLFQDITSQKEALSAAIKFEADLSYQKFALDQHAIVSIADLQGRIIYVNQRFTNISGYSAEELMGFNHNKVSSGQHGAAFWSMFWGTLKSGEIFRGEICNKRKDGSFYWVDSSVIPHFDQSGKIDRFISIRTDITQRKEAEAQQRVLEKNIQQMQKMEAIGQLVGGIAHDFNNILAVTNGYATLLKLELEEMPDKPRLADYASHIETAGERAKSLVQKMLSFARGGLKETESLTLSTVFKEFESIILALIPATTTVSTHIDDSELSVNLGAVDLSQILMNLCINANDAIFDNGVIAISAEHCQINQHACSSCGKLFLGDYVRIDVKDNGEGIRSELHKRIFEPFFSTKDAGRGSGMGLSVVHGIVHGAGGHIVLESSPETGTRVSLYLAADKVGADTPVLSSFQGAQGDHGKLLSVAIVDDEQAILTMLEKFLALNNISAKTFSNGDEAYRAICEEDNNIDVLLTDITMPQESGIDLCRRVKGSRPKMPVLAMTGYSNKISQQNFRSEYFDGFISKPIDMNELLEQLLKL